MPSYTFHIQKADHYNANGTIDLHVHVYFNDKGHNKLGRYRLPTLEPVFPNEPELRNSEIKALRDWLGEDEQIRKLTAFLKATLFDLHKMARLVPAFSEVMREDGNTYINIRIPVTERIR